MMGEDAIFRVEITPKFPGITADKLKKNSVVAVSSLAKLLHIYYPTADIFSYHANQRPTCVCHL